MSLTNSLDRGLRSLDLPAASILAGSGEKADNLLDLTEAVSRR